MKRKLSSCENLVEKEAWRKEFSHLESDNENRMRKGKLPHLKWSLNFGVSCLCFLLYLTVMMTRMADASGDSDWSNYCPQSCTCKWVHGKKQADCKGADYTSIPANLSHEIQVLDLSGNRISNLYADFFCKAGLCDLQKISLKNCEIETVDRKAFNKLTILTDLDLSGNKIRYLDMESFETNKRLREITLSDNPLSLLNGTGFPPLEYLQKIGLRSCQLSFLPKNTFTRLENVEQLDLSDNKFEYLSEDLFMHLGKLKSLELRDNPWNCDCRLKSFRDWVLSKQRLQSGTTCVEPPRLANFDWSQLLTSHFACSPKIHLLQINGKATDTLIVGDVGQPITLECLVKANPAAEVRWIKDNVSMTNASATATGKSYYVHISGESERWINLTIQHANLNNAGEYTCVGENKGGIVEKNVTLNFENGPKGAGVGTGHGTDSNRDSSWLWILIGILGLLLFVIALTLVVCLCSRKRRTTKTSRSQDLKGTQIQQAQPLVGRSTPSEGSVLGHSSSKDGTTPLLGNAKYIGERSGDGQDSDYPDLLDLPHRPQESPPSSSASTLPDSTRLLMPQQLNPAALYDPSRNSLNFIYGPIPAHLQTHPHILMGRPHSPYSGSVASFTSEPPQAIIPPPHKPGYVTLPRRPRVPSWSPSTHQSSSQHPSISTALSSSPSPSSIAGGGNYVKYDNLGPRTTADGSSKLSLNKLDNVTPGTPQAQQGYSTLPGRSPFVRPAPLPHYSPAVFNFDPIQENDGPPTPTAENVPSNYGLPEPPLSTLPRSWRPTAPSSSPLKENPRNKVLIDPNPDDSNKFSHEPLSPNAKKVPPKPPPKPKPHKKDVTEGQGLSSSKEEDDGTEV